MFPENFVTHELPGRTLRTSDKEYLYFSGTSYLGMAHNLEFNAYLTAGFKRYGTNYSSSRLSNVQLAIFAEAEDYLANFAGAGAALTVSSGFLAGQLVVRALAGKGTFLYSPGTHPALWLAPQMPNNQNFDQWLQDVPDLIMRAATAEVFILFNSLDPLYCKMQTLDWLKQLASLNKTITLIVDDSHGFGITGRQGAGVFEKLAVPPTIRKIVLGSLGKALGIPGGVVLTDEPYIQNFKASSFFGGGSPVAPAYLYAFLQSAEIYTQARTQLLSNIRYFTSLIKQPDLFCFFAGYPVFFTSQNQLYHYLLKQDILISSFSYPTPAHDPITRIVLNSLHTPTDIEILVEGINRFCAEKGPEMGG